MSPDNARILKQKESLCLQRIEDTSWPKMALFKIKIAVSQMHLSKIRLTLHLSCEQVLWCFLAEDQYFSEKFVEYISFVYETIIDV